MDARRRLIGIAAALAIGLALLQPPGGAAAEEQLEKANEPEFSKPLHAGAERLRSKSLDRN
jgi:hypothetical protein